MISGTQAEISLISYGCFWHLLVLDSFSQDLRTSVILAKRRIDLAQNIACEPRSSTAISLIGGVEMRSTTFPALLFLLLFSVMALPLHCIFQFSLLVTYFLMAGVSRWGYDIGRSYRKREGIDGETTKRNKSRSSRATRNRHQHTRYLCKMVGHGIIKYFLNSSGEHQVNGTSGRSEPANKYRHFEPNNRTPQTKLRHAQTST
uniref:Uncharacterized protein n=1 Tax=Morchella importuna TaxID=1174673 RepID=A0A650AFQ2_9PEZI|nr:hypothetical protein [Morchella importuna]QGN66731.1 hypothetical protein [Morchella importuna]